MTKKTSGPGWAFIAEEEPASSPQKGAGSPRPNIRLEKRAGKQVTVIAGLHTYGEQRLQEISRSLKTLCGVGGTVKQGIIEIQGDTSAQVTAWFTSQKAG